jgi:AcrR family transcriptional regulator
MTTQQPSRRQQAEERREQILDAAMRLFGQKGFQGTSIRDIAREVGITEGLIYHYFENKEQLLEACWRHRSWMPRMQAILDRAPGRPLDEVLRELIADFLTTLYANRESVVMCAVEMQHHPELAAFYMDRIEANRALIAGLVRSRQMSGEVRPDVDPVVVASVLLGAPYSLLLLYHSLPEEQWRTIADRHADGIAKMVTRGILADADEGP